MQKLAEKAVNKNTVKLPRRRWGISKWSNDGANLYR